ncbi:Uncharacterized protein OS=Sorangium cellulosum (strain So ce56) GN=sce5710 PE=4 SV=1 [Gemmata massiliana]|uniref:Uncharacterized protein n=1 Tax=Gemmata massiliana TaxID=1210884 RepID=A0A6P2CWE1_9BACT|nr:hypothetical protein [Gemmata massiliana]VTR93259.1 Uncharacterized protein OS=Sorangium cellulosum (strain So ce56) GN=sce5710 PE=4 SV=1 [Gemmata massiliana]
MTEAEWFAGADPTQMFKAIWRNISERKLRLFTCACCRRIWHVLSDHLTRPAVELAERLADGAATESEWDRVYSALIHHASESTDPEYLQVNAALGATCSYLRRDYPRLITNGLRLACRAAATLDPETGAQKFPFPAAAQLLYEEARQADLMRDVFGNPFRPVPCAPDWRTSTVTALAHGIYEDRAFDRMPILADAFQDAGCDNTDVLDHCRGAAEHARGCWVVDLVLGKG